MDHFCAFDRIAQRELIDHNTMGTLRANPKIGQYEIHLARIAHLMHLMGRDRHANPWLERHIHTIHTNNPRPRLDKKQKRSLCFCSKSASRSLSGVEG